MGKQVEVRLYQAGDEDEIVPLLQSVFNGWPKFDLERSAIDYWKWKYTDSPLKTNTLIVTESEGHIVGCLHGLCLKLKAGTRSWECIQGSDLAVDNNYRGLGIMGNMLLLRREWDQKKGIKIGYSISSNPIVNKWDEKNIHLKFPRDIGNHLKVFDIDLHLKMSNSKNKTIKKIGFSAVEGLKRLTELKKVKSHGFDIKIVDKPDDSFEVFWNKIYDYYNFIFERSREFLQWRYFDDRAGKYIVKKALLGNELLGYIVTRIRNDVKEYPTGFIMDLITLPNRLDVANALIQDALEDFQKNNVNIIDALVVKGNPVEALIRNQGFIHQSNFKVFHHLSDIGDDLQPFLESSPSKLHVNWGDTDWI